MKASTRGSRWVWVFDAVHDIRKETFTVTDYISGRITTLSTNLFLIFHVL